MGDNLNVDELQSNLAEYREQLQQVEQLLLDDPNNEEYSGIYEGLVQVVKLTEELLKEAGKEAAKPEVEGGPVAATREAPKLQVPSVLPPEVSKQIRLAQQRAAFVGQAPAAWAIDARVQALDSRDGLWHQATVTAVSVTDNFIIKFDNAENEEEVEREQIRECTMPLDSYRGVSAPKRHVVGSSSQGEMPKWLEIKPQDDEKTKLKKKKLMKSWKSKRRLEQMDEAQKAKAREWKSFLQSKKKLPGVKKTSIFRAPESSTAKVGVMGGGKATTKQPKRSRHDFGSLKM